MWRNNKLHKHHLPSPIPSTIAFCAVTIEEQHGSVALGQAWSQQVTPGEASVCKDEWFVPHEPWV